MTTKNGAQPSASDVAAIAAAESGQGAKRIQRYRMENGIVLKLKGVAPLIMREAASRIRDPQVPMAFIEAKGTEEPNPNDPEYIRELLEVQSRRSEAALTAALIMGTEIDEIPEGMSGPDDTQWSDDVETISELTGVSLPLNTTIGSKGRYLDWLRYYAISSETELAMLTRMLTIGVALTHEEVQAVAESFRRIFAGSANLENARTEPSADGSGVPGDATGDG